MKRHSGKMKNYDRAKILENLKSIEVKKKDDAMAKPIPRDLFGAEKPVAKQGGNGGQKGT